MKIRELIYMIEGEMGGGLEDSDVEVFIRTEDAGQYTPTGASFDGTRLYISTRPSELGEL